MPSSRRREVRAATIRNIVFIAVILGLIAAVAVVTLNVVNRPAPKSATEYIAPAEETAAPELLPLEVGGDRLMVAGDSLGSGFFASQPENSYAEIIAEAVGADEVLRPTLNEGELIGAGRIEEVPEDLDLAIIELGTNDVGDTEVTQFRKEYEDIIEKVRATSPNAALLCASVWRTDGEAYNTAILDLCIKNGGRYVSLNSAYKTPETKGPADVETFYGPSDDFHPNDKGHRLIADAFLAKLVL